MMIFYIIWLFRDRRSVYRLASVFFVFLAVSLSSYAQINLTPQTYKSNLPENGVGDWNDLATWLVWNGNDWEAPLAVPNRNSDVFLLKDNEVKLTGTEEVYHLYLYSASEPGRKLNLQTYELHVYGALRCFETDEDDFVIRQTTSALTDWIYPETGSIVFKGASRTVVDRDSWSGNNGNSRFNVVFDPDPGAELTVNSVFKSNGFLIKSGTVIQTVNFAGIPATSTFSFNTNNTFGTEDYGSLKVAAGATLITEGNEAFGPIISRSSSKPASSLILEEGAKLVFLGEQPLIEAADVKLEGSVYYVSESTAQEFASSTLPGSQMVRRYHHVFFEGSAEKNLPDTLVITGDIQRFSGGAIGTQTTSLIVTGNGDQIMNIPELTLENLLLDKPSGTFHVMQDLEVRKHFVQSAGDIDFHGRSFTINGDGDGGYLYSSGAWSALAFFHYQNLPLNLHDGNSSFPFFDRELMAQMTMVLQGTLTQPGQHLMIKYREIPGVNWNAGFDDNDGTPVLYHLHSYFDVSGTTTDTDLIEVRVFSDDMIIDHESDLRMVADGQAAVGTHLDASWIGGNLWTRRSLEFHELSNTTLSIGSTGELTILPIEWTKFEATETAGGTLLSWATKRHEEATFIIFRSTEPESFFVALTTISAHPSTPGFQFLDTYAGEGPVYYQVKVLQHGKVVSESPVIRWVPKTALTPLSVLPNPYQSGNLNIRLGDAFSQEENVLFQIIDSQGKLTYTWFGKTAELEKSILKQMTALSPGLYILWFRGERHTQSARWIRE
jgi:hypothetical protein